MNTELLTALGLNETQAKAYTTLVKHGSLTPPLAAQLLAIKRTNAYSVLDQLVELGLASKKDVQKKASYWAENPIALERLAKRKRDEALEHERQTQASMPTLLNYFHTFSSQPGVKFYQGIDGIQDIYTDMLRTRKDIYVVRSAHDQDFLSRDYFATFKQKKAKLGITTHLLNPESNKEVWNSETDATFKTIRTQVADNQYTADVEISTYGAKVAIISFGVEAIGMIIHSPQIAEAYRQLLTLAVAGAERK